MKQETKKRIIRTWRERPLYVKIAMIIGMIASIGVIVFAVLGLTGVMKDAANIYMPLMAVTMLAQGIREWKTSIVVAIPSFAAAVFIVIVACMKWFG